MQAIYDDTAALFSLLQFWPTDEVPPHKLAADFDRLLTPIHDNLGQVQQTLESLLAVGYEQAELGQADYRENIGRRLSRLSLMDEHLGGGARRMSTFPEEMEDVVDMDYAFHKPATSSSAHKPSSSFGKDSEYMRSTHRSQRSVADSVTTDPTIVAEEEFQDEPSPFDDESACFPLEEDDVRLTSFAAPRPKPQGRQKDLSRLLGPGFSEPQPPPETPWYLLPNYNPEEILIDTDNSIKGGTVPALVERLTAHEFSGKCFPFWLEFRL